MTGGDGTGRTYTPYAHHYLFCPLQDPDPTWVEIQRLVSAALEDAARAGRPTTVDKIEVVVVPDDGLEGLLGWPLPAGIRWGLLIRSRPA